MTGQDWLTLSIVCVYGATLITAMAVVVARQQARQDELDGNRQMIKAARWLLARGITTVVIAACPACRTPVLLTPDHDEVICGRCHQVYTPAVAAPGG